MFGIGPLELVVILVVALLVFGPKRVPELARTIGKGLAEFRRASNDLRQTLALDELQRDLERNLSDNSDKETIHRPGDRPAQAGDDVDPKAQQASEVTDQAPTETAQPDVSPESPAADDDADNTDDADDLDHQDAGADLDAESIAETNSNSAADSELGNIPVSGSDPKRG